MQHDVWGFKVRLPWYCPVVRHHVVCVTPRTSSRPLHVDHKNHAHVELHAPSERQCGRQRLIEIFPCDLFLQGVLASVDHVLAPVSFGVIFKQQVKGLTWTMFRQQNVPPRPRTRATAPTFHCKNSIHSGRIVSRRPSASSTTIGSSFVGSRDRKNVEEEAET